MFKRNPTKASHSCYTCISTSIEQFSDSKTAVFSCQVSAGIKATMEGPAVAAERKRKKKKVQTPTTTGRGVRTQLRARGCGFGPFLGALGHSRLPTHPFLDAPRRYARTFDPRLRFTDQWTFYESSGLLSFVYCVS